MRKYPLHYMNEDDFEQLTMSICSKILGEGVIPFAKGSDGGRDGRFTGKANCFPSEQQSWDGKFVVEAKHTSKENASCSDYEFKKRLKNEVAPAIKRNLENNKVDYYLLFTNRKLTGKQDEKIEDYIDEETGVTNIIIADERIQQFLRSYPDIVRSENLNVLLRPLQFDEEDLKDIVIKVHENIPSKEELEKSYTEIKYLDLEKKNELNTLGQDYFSRVLKNSFHYFESINAFLTDTINEEYKELYYDTADEINAKIHLNREDYACFESLLEDFFDYVITNNKDLKGKKRLVRVFLHYMYCNCDIGKKE